MQTPQIETFSEPSVFLKMLEFLLSLIATSVEQGGMATFGSVGKEFFGGGVLVMSLTVSTQLFLCFIFGGQRDLQKTRFEISFNGVMSLFMVIAGVLVIDAYTGVSGTVADHANTAGSFCIINAAVYGIDTYFAVVNHLAIPKTETPE